MSEIEKRHTSAFKYGTCGSGECVQSYATQLDGDLHLQRNRFVQMHITPVAYTPQELLT